MLCTGSHHTIAVSDDGSVYGFGSNGYGKLGCVNNENVLVPNRIVHLPKIQMVSCGEWYTVCIDYEFSMWSFGYNVNGQLGTGDTKNYNYPQKINIPPVTHVSCGACHTLVVTNDDSNLWSFGWNRYGQLFEKTAENRITPQQTSFTNVSKISAGGRHSFLQNYEGQIYGCGNNENGELGLGNFTSPDKPCLINVPPNIVHFCCGHIIHYLLTWKEMYFPLDLIISVIWDLVIGKNKIKSIKFRTFHPSKQYLVLVLVVI